MQAVSQDYRVQSNKPVRNPSMMRITFGVVDPEAVDASTITANGEMLYSDVNKIDVEQYVMGRQYGRLYENGFPLDASMYLLPDDEMYEYNGYVSSMISGADNVFPVKPMLTVTFSEHVSLSGLTMTFNKLTNNYPTEIEVRIYDDDVLIGTQIAENDNPRMVYENTIPGAGVTNKIEVLFNKTSNPYRDVLIEHIVFGIIQVFTDDNLETVSSVRDIDLVNQRLPVETLSFTVIDAPRDYDPENPIGLWQYLEEEQQITAEVGYQLDDGTEEWVPLCNYYTTGDVSITPTNIPRVTFEAVSLLGYITDDYVGGVYRPDGINLFDLATEIMQGLDLPLNKDGSVKWRFDEVQMRKYTTMTPLSVMPVRDALQLISGACGCVLYTDREGNINIQPHSYDFIAHPQFRLSFENIYAPPIVTKFPMLRDIIVNYADVQIETTSSQLYSVELNVAEQSPFEFKYKMSTGQSVATDGTLTVIGTPVYYAERCYMTLEGAGKLTISGNTINLVEVSHSQNYNVIGDDCPATLNLINTIAHAKEYAEYLYNYVNLRTQYEVDDRGYMELDPLDTVFADTGYGGYKGVVVSKSELNYNGGLRGATKYYQAVDYSQFTDNAVALSDSQAIYSTVGNILLPDIVIEDNYGRVYDNGLVLDGNTIGLPDDGNYEVQGYVSDVISDGDGIFAEKPSITISFDRYVISQNGLTLTFADDGNYADSITLKAYDNDVLVGTLELANDNRILVHTEIYPAESSMNKMEIIFNGTYLPYRDVKLNNIYFGVR